MFLLLTLNIFLSFFNVSVVDIKQVNIGWLYTVCAHFLFTPPFNVDPALSIALCSERFRQMLNKTIFRTKPWHPQKMIFN